LTLDIIVQDAFEQFKDHEKWGDDKTKKMHSYLQGALHFNTSDDKKRNEDIVDFLPVKEKTKNKLFQIQLKDKIELRDIMRFFCTLRNFNYAKVKGLDLSSWKEDEKASSGENDPDRGEWFKKILSKIKDVLEKENIKKENISRLQRIFNAISRAREKDKISVLERCAYNCGAFTDYPAEKELAKIFLLNNDAVLKKYSLPFARDFLGYLIEVAKVKEPNSSLPDADKKKDEEENYMKIKFIFSDGEALEINNDMEKKALGLSREFFEADSPGMDKSIKSFNFNIKSSREKEEIQYHLIKLFRKYRKSNNVTNSINSKIMEYLRGYEINSFISLMRLTALFLECRYVERERSFNVLSDNDKTT